MNAAEITLDDLINDFADAVVLDMFDVMAKNLPTKVVANLESSFNFTHEKIVALLQDMSQDELWETFQKFSPELADKLGW